MLSIAWSSENPPTVYVKVYQGVEDGLHQLVVQRLQVVVPQLQPLQRVQVIKGVVLNRGNADGGKGFGHNFFSFGTKLTGCFEARDSLCAPRNPGGRMLRSYCKFETLFDMILKRICLRSQPEMHWTRWQ